MLRWCAVPTPWGSMVAVSGPDGLRRLDWMRCPSGMRPDVTDPVLIEVVAQVQAFVDGRLERFDLPLAAADTCFRRRVREALHAIPPGEVRTYGDVAEMLGLKRSASRAVGTACAANPHLLVTPCHRVVPASGGVGGYAGEPWRKDLMLHFERQTFALAQAV